MDKQEFVKEVEQDLTDNIGLVDTIYDEIVEIAEQNNIDNEEFSKEQAQELALIVVEEGFNSDNF